MRIAKRVMIGVAVIVGLFVASAVIAGLVKGAGGDDGKASAADASSSPSVVDSSPSPVSETPAAAATPKRVPPAETVVWATQLRDADKAAQARPALSEYESAFSNLTGMCREQGDELAALVKKAAVSPKLTFLDDPAGRRYTAIGWLASMHNHPASDCTTVVTNYTK